jgi:hypothetical protein
MSDMTKWGLLQIEKGPLGIQKGPVPDFKAKLDKYYPRQGKPTQLSMEFADDEADTGKGL